MSANYPWMYPYKQEAVQNIFILYSFNTCTFLNIVLVISLNIVTVDSVRSFNLGLISRRSIHRAGTRLFSRGIDSTGNVSNYVETEQLIEVNGHRISFVQTRGSIPLFWYQAPNLKYKPKPQLSIHEDHQTACARHFEAQIFHYGKQILINLVSHYLESIKIFIQHLLSFKSCFFLTDRSTWSRGYARKSIP